jgi:hypothetical protein
MCLIEFVDAQPIPEATPMAAEPVTAAEPEAPATTTG